MRIVHIVTMHMHPGTCRYHYRYKAGSLETPDYSPANSHTWPFCMFSAGHCISLRPVLTPVLVYLWETDCK